MAQVDYSTLLSDVSSSIDLTNATSVTKWDAITNWLAKLYLLQGVPFHYLVPDARMLPVESIKYFQVDQNWLTALIDGAYSIGRTAAVDAPNLSEWIETQLYPNLNTAVSSAASLERAKQIQPNNIPAAVTDLQNSTLTGFILRSQAVSDFKNMQVVGYDSSGVPTPSLSGTPLPIIRLDHLAKDVLIGIFIGTLYRLDLREPSEGLHYGVDSLSSANGVVSSFLKKLRNANGEESLSTELTGTNSNNTAVSATVSGATLFRTPVSGNYQPSGPVLNMYELSTAMFSELGDEVPYSSAETDVQPSATPKPITTLTSADFALQFTEGTSMVSYYFSGSLDSVTPS